ncbi:MULTISPECIES: hypothetical protein [unclassified Aureimonas]|uniref:hypothetical protein n=1 Tax=unclassified Aureimonas TaxID=2615206 RepID=UPI0006F6757F|nr:MULTISPECIES: hypothetical protein [unclassified Aureimonas]KQT61282.1 hypothetical protein ASG54_24420 [Aureimonas sp. Leaf460]KQT68731.1 hypothetical protein ASG62_19180 [Aureimonas sp. Leaf427]
MSAAIDHGVHRAVERMDGAFEQIEFEIALDLEDPILSGFKTSVRTAAEAVGGEFLFDMPADGMIDDASRIAAIRIPRQPRDIILFALLDASGTGFRIASKDEIGERFYGFARAFVGVLEKIRKDVSLDAARA